MSTPTLTDFTTLTGLTLAEALAKLDEQLPADAYSPVPGPVALTDIDPGYMRHVLNAVFGPCGLGWGYTYESADLELTFHEKTVTAMLKRLEFWYILVNDAVKRHTLYATGASDNRNAQYAMKGALTNAIGNAVSNIGFQESVYLGKRSHATVGAKLPRPVPPKPAAAPTEPPKKANGHIPTTPAVSSQVDAATFWKQANAALKAGLTSAQVESIAQAAKQIGWATALEQLNQQLAQANPN